MKKFISFLFLISAMLVLFHEKAQCQPPIPSGFWGTIQINGENAPVGTIITPTINGIPYPASDTVDVAGTYGMLYVNGDDPSTTEIIEGGKEGDEIIFTASISGQPYVLSPTGVWHSGTDQRLDLVDGAEVPVELASFTARVNGNSAILKWVTLSESDNFGFEIQRKFAEKDFQIIGFISGQNTTSEPQYYTFTDKNLSPGVFNYRLKQIDLDGSFQFSPTLALEIKAPGHFRLVKNFPNPFNPATWITYEMDRDAFVKITIINTSGQRVKTLIDNFRTKGLHRILWDGRDDENQIVAGGIYFCQMKSESVFSTLKLILLR